MISNFTSIAIENPVPTSVAPAIPCSARQSRFTVKRLQRPINALEYIPSHHVLLFNVGPSVSLWWKYQGQWIMNHCAAGSIVAIVPAGERQEFTWNDEANFLELAFDPGFMNTILQKEKFVFQDVRNVFDPLVRDLVINLFEAMQAGCLETLYAESLAVTCAIHLGTIYSGGEKRIFAPKGKLSSYQLKNVIEHVRTCIHSVITLEELAATIHLSVFHFSRLFKSTVGLSPYQFVLRMKIECAKRFIKQKEPIGEIAYKLGFTDSAHFCNAFKKITGQSPLQFDLSTQSVSNHY
jgi:AraC family transcriptional regulator